MMPPRPACFPSDEDWARWRRQAKHSRANPDVPFTYCQDCEFAFKAAMVRAGRCGNVSGKIMTEEDEEE
jgi:hypothetical protein